MSRYCRIGNARCTSCWRSRAWCTLRASCRRSARIGQPAPVDSPRPDTWLPIPTAMTAIHSPTTISSATRASARACLHCVPSTPSIFCASPAVARAGCGPAGPAGGAAAVPGTAGDVAGRSAGRLERRTGGARGFAQLAVPQRRRRHVLPAGAGVRSPARPLRAVRLGRCRGRLPRARRATLPGLVGHGRGGANDAPRTATGREPDRPGPLAPGAGRRQRLSRAACRWPARAAACARCCPRSASGTIGAICPADASRCF